MPRTVPPALSAKAVASVFPTRPLAAAVADTISAINAMLIAAFIHSVLSSPRLALSQKRSRSRRQTRTRPPLVTVKQPGLSLQPLPKLAQRHRPRPTTSPITQDRHVLAKMLTQLLLPPLVVAIALRIDAQQQLELRLAALHTE